MKYKKIFITKSLFKNLIFFNEYIRFGYFERMCTDNQNYLQLDLLFDIIIISATTFIIKKLSGFFNYSFVYCLIYIGIKNLKCIFQRKIPLNFQKQV